MRLTLRKKPKIPSLRCPYCDTAQDISLADWQQWHDPIWPDSEGIHLDFKCAACGRSWRTAVVIGEWRKWIAERGG